MKNKKIKILILYLIVLSSVSIIMIMNQNLGYLIFSSENLNTTYVSLRFDDGLKSQIQAFDLLREYNLTGSVYIIPNKLNSSIDWEKNYYLNPEELKKVSDFLEIGAHTKTHVDLIRNPKYKQEIIESKQLLEKENFTIKTFVYPGGNYNPEVISEVMNNFECASTQDIGTNYLPINPYLLKDFTLRNYNSFETAKRVIKKNSWNIITFHDIGSIEKEEIPESYKKVANSNSFSLEEFKKIIIYLKQNNITVITIEDGCKKFK